jgi:hypothetical protein
MRGFFAALRMTGMFGHEEFNETDDYKETGDQRKTDD